MMATRDGSGFAGAGADGWEGEGEEDEEGRDRTASADRSTPRYTVAYEPLPRMPTSSYRPTARREDRGAVVDDEVEAAGGRVAVVIGPSPRGKHEPALLNPSIVSS